MTKGIIIYTEGKGEDRLFITQEVGEFLTYVYRNGVGKPELIGTGHDIRSAMAFINLHKPKGGRAKISSKAEILAFIGR